MAELFPGLKEDVISGKVSGLNEQQARDVFGNDFTGLTLVDGQYRIDNQQGLDKSSAISRLLPAPISPSTPDLKSTLNNAGYASSTLDQELADLQRGKDSTKDSIRSEFGRLKELEGDRSVAELGQIGRTTSIAGGVGASGLGASTTRGQLLQLEQTASTRRIAELTKYETEALGKLDFEYAKTAADLRKTELERSDKLRQLEFENKLSLLNYGLGASQEIRANKQLDLQTVETLSAIPEGQTVTIGGVTYTGLKKNEIEPFFKGSDIVQLMKTLPVGQSQTVTDPATGQQYTLTGIAQPDISTQIFESEDAAGNVTYVTVDKNTGSILSQVSAGKIGKGFAPSGDGSGNNDRDTIKLDIDAIKGSDKYLDTAKYAEVRENVALNSPSLLSWFDSTYKPEDVLNPNDPTAKKYFQTGAQQIGNDEDDSPYG